MISRRQRLTALLAPLALFACDRLVSPPETKDRMPPERLARMVYRPVALAEHGDLAAGEDALKALIRPLGTSKDDMIRRADLLKGQGVRGAVRPLRKRVDPAAPLDLSCPFAAEAADAREASITDRTRARAAERRFARL